MLPHNKEEEEDEDEEAAEEEEVEQSLLIEERCSASSRSSACHCEERRICASLLPSTAYPPSRSTNVFKSFAIDSGRLLPEMEVKTSSGSRTIPFRHRARSEWGEANRALNMSVSECLELRKKLRNPIQLRSKVFGAAWAHEARNDC